MLRTSIVLGGLIVALAGSAEAGRRRARLPGALGIVVPPVEIDVGGGVPLAGGEASAPSIDVLAGMHWASLAWNPTSFDIGAGYVGTFRQISPGAMSIARTTQPTAGVELLSLNGAYLSLGHKLAEHRHVRAWLSARGELLEGKIDGRYEVVPGGAVRISVELFAREGKAGRSGNAVGVLAGAVGVGFYVEASHRGIPSELGATGVSTGLSFRLPFILAGAG